MKLLTKTQILEARDLTFEDVDVPEWGGTVRVRALSGWERDRFEDGLMTGRGKKRQVSMQNARARLAALTIIDEEGQPLFAEADTQALGRKSAAALERVFEVAMRLAGISDGDMEEMTENFTPGQNGAFTSS